MAKYLDPNQEEARAKLKDAEEKLGAMTAERDAAVAQLRRTARKMKADGMAVEAIVKYTGLSVMEIRKL